MSRWKKQLVFPLLRISALFAILCLVYLLWNPGDVVSDGRFDRGMNGVWLQHGWLGDDDWFDHYQRDRTLFRDGKTIDTAINKLKAQGIHYVFPHLCPATDDGGIALVDDAQVERYLDRSDGIEVIPWIGGILDAHCFPRKPEWRAKFCKSVADLFDRHPRLAGVQVNIEPLASFEPGYLELLDELRVALPEGKTLSVAAYPPPTRWHPYPEVHWEEDFFRQVAERVDLIVPMMYDTGITYPKLYEKLMATWTKEVIDWSGDTAVLLGVPAYDDSGVDYHDPESENLLHAIRGINAGLNSYDELPANYRGIAIYAEWTMTPVDWQTLEREFSR